jgi:plastocyanin
MRRLTAAAAIGLLGTVITLAPVHVALAGETPAGVPTTEVPATTVAPAPEASTSTVPAINESTTAPTSAPTTTVAATGVVSSTSRTAPRTIANARATTDHIINVSTNCTYFCFAPAQMTITAGETVTWSNRSGTAHNVKRCDPTGCNGKSGGTGTDANFGSAIIALRAGGTFQYTFDQPGTYVYYCTIHGYSLMHGTITVTAAPPSTLDLLPLPTPQTNAPATIASGPHLASTGGSTDGTLVVAAIMLVLGLAAASAGVRRNRA